MYKSPIRKVVRHLLTMPDSAKFKDERTGHTLAIPWMNALIEWDRVHPVRYRLWRIYVNLSVSPLTHYRLHVRRPIRKFVQRGRRGWSEEDAWSFDTYLAGVIAGATEFLRGGYSYPGEFESEAPWIEDGGVLDRMASGFRGYVEGKFVWDRDDPGYDKLNESMELFVKWFGNLWD